jgi:hypothetical protein
MPHCTNEELDRDDAHFPVYKALSRTWRDAIVRENMQLNGTTVPATTNLYEAHMQSRDAFPDTLFLLD